AGIKIKYNYIANLRLLTNLEKRVLANCILNLDLRGQPLNYRYIIDIANLILYRYGKYNIS
ncbi:hypothetical protein CC78DRAFT_481243, partial [Lojkania enalia]